MGRISNPVCHNSLILVSIAHIWIPASDSKFCQSQPVRQCLRILPEPLCVFKTFQPGQLFFIVNPVITEVFSVIFLFLYMETGPAESFIDHIIHVYRIIRAVHGDIAHQHILFAVFTALHVLHLTRDFPDDRFLGCRLSLFFELRKPLIHSDSHTFILPVTMTAPRRFLRLHFRNPFIQF